MGLRVIRMLKRFRLLGERFGICRKNHGGKFILNHPSNCSARYVVRQYAIAAIMAVVLMTSRSAAAALGQLVNPPAESAVAPAAAKPAATPPAGQSSTDLHLALTKELLVLSKEVDAMQKRIAQVEAELKASESNLSETGAATDAGKLNDALKELNSGTSSGQAVAVPPPAATPPPPEIPAQTTTKGEPFPGDWTWLNNNGHQADSPMATKYFTPEFRADANYTIDMNHPEDDTLGGSTETFRSDEWRARADQPRRRHPHR